MRKSRWTFDSIEGRWYHQPAMADKRDILFIGVAFLFVAIILIVLLWG